MVKNHYINFHIMKNCKIYFIQIVYDIIIVWTAYVQYLFLTVLYCVIVKSRLKLQVKLIKIFLYMYHLKNRKSDCAQNSIFEIAKVSNILCTQFKELDTWYKTHGEIHEIGVAFENCWLFQCHKIIILPTQISNLKKLLKNRAKT